jgi:hypothetical protein
VRADLEQNAPNLSAHYFHLSETTVVRQAIETVRISVSSGGHYWCQQLYRDEGSAAQNGREMIGLDTSAVSADLQSGEWKGATVLAGSCCEALLLYGLQTRDTSSRIKRRRL